MLFTKVTVYRYQKNDFRTLSIFSQNFNKSKPVMVCISNKGAKYLSIGGSSGSNLKPWYTRAKEKIVDECYHYYYGTKLFMYDIYIATRYTRKALNGKNLSTRQRTQLRRTFIDIFRMVPFIVLVLIPFAEFVLPFIVKLFPGFLPTTYRGHVIEKDIWRKKLSLDLEYRSAMYEEIERYHFKRTKMSKSQTFAKLMDDVKAGRKKLTYRQLLKYSSYVDEDDLHEILTSEQVSNIFKDLWKHEVPVVESMVDEMTLKTVNDIKNNDNHLKELFFNGFDGITRKELEQYAEMRGLQFKMVDDDQLKMKLHRWVDYSLNYKVPILFMLLTRIAESQDAEFINDIIKTLPERLLNEMEINIADEEGEKLSNETMFEIVKHEENLIKEEENDGNSFKAPIKEP